MKEFKILDIKMHKANMQEICDLVKKSALNNQRLVFSWNNPETIYQSQKDLKLKTYFNNVSNFNFVDGGGIILLKSIFGENVGPRNTGTDFLPKLCEISSKYDIKLYFLGGKPGVALKTIENFTKKFNQIKIAGYHHGYFNEAEENKIVEEINKSKADVLAVFLGCPLQERFIQKHFDILKPSVIYGGGGGLDYYSGVVSRAPRIIILMGIEFLWRLFQDFNFKRLKRQSVYPIFTLKTLFDEANKKFLK